MKQRGKISPGHISTISGSGKGHIQCGQTRERVDKFRAGYDKIDWGSKVVASHGYTSEVVTSELPGESIVETARKVTDTLQEALASAKRGAAIYRATLARLATGSCVCACCMSLGLRRPDVREAYSIAYHGPY